MSIPFPGFCGPSYQLSDRYAAVERTVNWLQLVNEASEEEQKFKYALDPMPGNAAFGQLPVPAPFNQPNRGLLECREGCYGVNGTVVFFLSSGGVYTQIGGPIANDGKPVSMVANGNAQIFIASAGQGYVIAAGGAGSTIQAIPISDFLGSAYATFQDGYILSVVPGTNKYQISGSDSAPVGDATQWSASNVSVEAGQADNLAAISSSREYVRVCGLRRSQIHQNVGANGTGNFPFSSYNETFIETGLAATFSLVDLGDAWMWIGQDARGMRAAWIDQLADPQRASTFAVEQAWQGYASVADAVAFAFIWDGHLIWRVTFPSAVLNTVTGRYTSRTWDYYVTDSRLARRQIWTEAQYSSSTMGLIGRSEMFHAYCYGLHLVGSAGQDGNPGAVYQYSDSTFTDCGADAHGAQDNREIVRDRICPHLWTNNKRVIYNRLELECARGVGLSGNPAVGQNPAMYLSWSNNYGKTFGSWRDAPVGLQGQYAERVYWNGLGYARDRVFWARYTDPTYMGLVGAELDLTPCGS